MKRKRG